MSKGFFKAILELKKSNLTAQEKGQRIFFSLHCRVSDGYLSENTAVKIMKYLS